MQNKKHKQLLASNQELLEEVGLLKGQILNIEQREKQRRNDDANKHAEDVDVLRRQNAAWKEQLELLLSAPCSGNGTRILSFQAAELANVFMPPLPLLARWRPRAAMKLFALSVYHRRLYQ